jgi:D-arabinose 1-dehydrogenase-like Zn-dependent alcohol dehydrogenase
MYNPPPTKAAMSESMRVAAFTEIGDDYSVDVVEQEMSDPDAGEVILDVEACSINHHDLRILEGGSSNPELPFVSGLDVAGTVNKTGPGVDYNPGDRVVLCPNQTCGTCRHCREGPENLCEEFSLFHGGLAEQVHVTSDRLIPLPDSVTFTDAAAIPTAYMTAFHMLRRADIEATDLVFVPGATGGVGIAALQLTDILGSRSIGTTTSNEKAERLESVADHVINAEDIEEIKSEVESIGVPDAVINHMAGRFTDLGLSVMRRGGRMVICGETVDDSSEIDIPQLYFGHQQVIGSTMGTQLDLERLVTLLEDELINPPIGETYELEETEKAFNDMRTRDAFGKLVIEP